MRYGIILTAGDIHEIAAMAAEAEDAGWDGVFYWDGMAIPGADPIYDPWVTLAAVAMRTKRVRFGAIVTPPARRRPWKLARETMTLDQLSGGRMRLGIGPSGPQVAEGWHGQRFARQLQRTREYVEILRKALARDRLEYDGEVYTLPIPDGPGKALKLMIAPVQERMPIYIAAIGPNNTKLTGEIADGWLPIFFSPEHVAAFRPLLEEGAARAGRSLEGFDVCPTVNVFVTDDVAAARDAMRPFVALYVGGMGSREKNFYNALVRRYGFEEEAQAVQDLYLDGRRQEAMARLSDELIDTVTLCGPPDRVRERLAVYREAGVGTLGVTPVAFTKPERLEQLRLVAELAA